MGDDDVTLQTALLVLNTVLFFTFVSASVWQSRLQALGVPDSDRRVIGSRQISIVAFVVYLIVGITCVGLFKDAEALAIVVVGLALIFGIGWLWAKRAAGFSPAKKSRDYLIRYRLSAAALAFMFLVASFSLLQMLAMVCHGFHDSTVSRRV